MLQPPNQKHWMVRSDILTILLEGILFVCFVYFMVNSDCMNPSQNVPLMPKVQSDPNSWRWRNCASSGVLGPAVS